MRIALTGVPGTGKTTLATAFGRDSGWRVVHLNEFARAAGLAEEKDERRGSDIVDMDELAARFNAVHDALADDVLVEGHFAHEMDVDVIVLLRVEPLALIERLRARGWSDEKVRENVEAEALDVLAQEVLDTGVPAVEMDATRQDVESLARQLLAIAESPPEALKGSAVGSAHWPLESLPWF